MLSNKLKQVWRGAMIGAVLAMGLGVVLLKLGSTMLQPEVSKRINFPPATKLVHLSYDLPFVLRPIKQPTEVVMVYMDDKSHADLEQPYDRPWDRGFHAQLVERLTQDGAKAIIFDVIFSGPNKEHPEGDDQFARAIKTNGKVILGAEYGTTPDGSAGMYSPFDPFSEGAAAIGFVEVTPDEDFIPRRHLHIPQEKEADSYSSFTWEAANFIGSPFAQDPNERFRERWINYYGPRGTIPSISFVSALDTNRVPIGAFSNKVVFVGSSLKTEYSGKHKDEYYTPYSKGILCPAIDVQATQLLNLIHGDWLTHLSSKIELLVIILSGILFGAGLAFFRPLVASLLAILGIVAITVIAHFLFFQYRLWFSWMIIIAAQLPIALLWSIIFNSVQLYVQNKLFEQSLEMYLSPKLVKKFAANKDLLKPGAKKETLTILFSDIAGFTSISEGMDSDELAKHMNSYFQTAVSGCIHHTDGTIVKYIGDAIFAFWNAPDPQNDHQLRACEAALRFRDQPPQYMNEQQLITRIGLHTGVANVGNFGSTARVDYTALGENINLASRMEGLNKYLGTEVLITQETFEGIQGRLLARFLGLFRLKGFEKNVGVYELVGTPDKAESVRALHEAFAAALKLFQEKKFIEAEAAFQKVLAIKPNDGPAKFYLKHIAELPQPSPAR
ncbi:MAG: adenylate/guanylate cyclase domain-containing protein [Limisphaerales bacterium]